MSSDIAISVRGLSKEYVIAHEEKHTTLGENILARLRNPMHRPKTERFQALKDVTFDITKGDVVGIIGRNGAGKSTLLKIMSRITEPTSGEVKVYGRVASLLEVGTGFHPELTGRENIFLNGAILGMTRAEIRGHFDEIVAFAEIEKFLDTPVKRYSSGMYVRLAFAVAAHLNPEILIVDEVLSVGDASFQKKCLGRMGEVARGGRTVLFVSHNTKAVEALCGKICWLEHGRVRQTSENVRDSISQYLSAGVEGSGFPIEWRNPGTAMTNSAFQPLRFYIGNDDGSLATMPARNDNILYAYIEGAVTRPDIALNVGYSLYDNDGSLLYWTATTDSPEEQWPPIKAGRVVLRSQLPSRLLNEGQYRLELLVSLYHRQWISCPGSNAPVITITINGGLSESPYWMERRPGILAPVLNWALHEHSAAK